MGSPLSRVDEVLAAVEGVRPNAKGWARGNCPFCEVRRGTIDRSRCLGLHMTSGRWHCFRCRSGGVVREEVRRELDDLLQDVGEEEESAVDDENVLRPDRLPPACTALFESPGWENTFYAVARRYVRSRISDQVGVDASIGACLDGPCAGRIVIPVFDVTGAIDGWAARDYTQRSYLRYRTPDGWSRSLHNIAGILAQTDEPLFLCEGGFDSLALWPDATCFFGKPTPEQLLAVLETERPIVCALDGDAWRECEMLALQLRALGAERVGWLRLPPKKDPGKLGAALRAAAPEALKHGRAIIEG